MIFFKRNDATSSTLRIEDYIPLPEFESLSPQHQKFIKKLFRQPSAQLEKFISKLSTNGICISRDMLEKMIEQLYLESQLPLKAFSQESLKKLQPIPFNQHDSQVVDFWIDMLKKLKIWDHASVEESVMFGFFRLIFQMLSSDELGGMHWEEKNPQPPEMTVLKYLYFKFKFFHAEQLTQAKRPMDLYELFCLFEDAAYAINLIQSSHEHVDFLRALNASALLLTCIQLFPAAIPDCMAYFLEQHPEAALTSMHFLKKSDFDIFFGQHLLIEKLNGTSFIFCMSQFIQEEKLINSDVFVNRKILEFQNISKRLIFIFNRLTGLGYLLRSPHLKGLGYHPLIHTELPKKFAEQLPLLLAFYEQLPQKEQLQIMQYCSLIEKKPQQHDDFHQSIRINR